MNTELVESALSAHGRRLVVLDDGEVDDDLVRDMVEPPASFCARPYGRRSARNRTLKAVSCAPRDIGPRPLSVPEGRMPTMSERVSLGTAGKRLGVSGGDVRRAGYTKVTAARLDACEHEPALWLRKAQARKRRSVRKAADG